MGRKSGCFCLIVAGVLAAGDGAEALAAVGGSGPMVAGDVALSYHAIPGCPGEEAFRERAADHFRFHDPFVRAGEAAAGWLRVEVGRGGKGFRATISVLEKDGSVRASTFEVHENCDALVYVVASRMMMIMRDFPRPEPPQGPSQQSFEELKERVGRLEEGLRRQGTRADRLEEKVEVLEERTRALERKMAALEKALADERKRKMLTYTVSAGLLLTANLTPAPGPGVWLGGDLRIDPLSIGIELRTALPSRFEIGADDFDMSHYVGLLTPCGRYFIFFGCAVAGAGVQMIYDSNATLVPGQSNSGFAPLVQLGGRLGVEVPLGETPLAVRGWAEVLYATPSYEAIYTHGDQKIRVERPDVSAFFGLGLVVKFGDKE